MLGCCSTGTNCSINYKQSKWIQSWTTCHTMQQPALYDYFMNSADSLFMVLNLGEDKLMMRIGARPFQHGGSWPDKPIAMMIDLLMVDLLFVLDFDLNRELWWGLLAPNRKKIEYD